MKPILRRRAAGAVLTIAALCAIRLWTAPIQATASTTGLVGYWRFDERSGISAVDSSGSGNTGTLVNGPTWTASGRIGGALSFDGVNDRVNLASDPIGTGTVTACLWARTTVVNAFRSALGNGRFHFGLYANNSRLQVISNTSSGTGLLSASNTAVAAVWQHLCTVRNAGTNGPASLYVNGSLNASGNTKTPIAGYGLAIGSAGQFTELPWSGLIDEVRVYNRALSAQEILAVYEDSGAPLPPDVVAPTVSMSAPSNGATVTGTAVTVSALASDNVGVMGVQFLLDGVNLGTEDTASPYSISWNSTSAFSGPHSLSARARDAAGNTTIASAVLVTVDNQGPTGTVVINAGAAVTNSTAVTLTLSAADPAGVTQMRFSNTGSSYSAAEAYATTKAWTLSTGKGTKTVYVQFKDGPGNWSGAFTDTIVYDNTAPTISAVASSNITHSSATITWTTNEAATSEVEYGPTLSYGTLTPIDNALVVNHSMQLTGLAAQTTYNFRVRSTDAAGNQRIGTNNTLTTAAGPDVTPPTAPANLSATVISPTQINLSWAAASDNVGVTGYLVFRDGNQVASPTALTYADSGLARGSGHTYVVHARDAAGNVSGPSAPVSAATPAFVITGVSSSNVTANAVTISWTTDVPASSAVEYGSTASYGLETEENPALFLSHVEQLSGLAQNSTYHFRVRSTDANGNTLRSGDAVFTTLPAGQTGAFVNESLISNLDLPVSIEFLPDGRMLILELAGVIRILAPGATQVEPTPFLQLANVGHNGIQGLFDMVLDPDFLNNHYYYVFYTLGSPNRDRLSRFTANAAMTGTVAGSEFVIYQDPLDAQSDHHGGALNFGNDGKLYVTTGEHFNVNSEAQDLSSGRGKILRYNSDGTIPADNPFHDGAGPNMDAVWALGLRNPFRASFDSVTGRLFVGDVGGNEWATAIEEVNIGTAGANFGWPQCEGACSNPAFTNPIYAYAHDNRDASVTGGFVYRGTQFPAAYVGSYFFADYTQNWIKRLTFDANGNVDEVLNFEPPDGSVDGPYGDIVDLQQGPDGALYYVDIGYSDTGGNTDGIAEVRRIRYISSDPPPVAAASANPLEGAAPLSVAFSSAGSFDPDNQPLSYLWDFGDGTNSTEANPVHIYTQVGPYTARLTVSDGNSGVLAEPISITVGQRPTPTILTPATGIFFRAGDVVSFSGSATDPEDGTLPASAFAWTIDFLHGTHVHPGVPQSGFREGTFQIPTAGHDFSGDTRYRITLTVTDSDALRTATSVLIFPQKVNLSFDTVPSGLTLNLDTIARQTPFVHDSLVGFNHTLEAPNQTVAQTVNTFAAWSDGGGQQHNIVVPASDTSYTAVYTVTQTSNLVAAYNFDEGTGSALTDRSGNGNDGTIAGATWTTGKYGGALQFNGTTSLVTIADSTSLHVTSAFTLEAWVYASATSTGWRDVIHKSVDNYFLEGSSWGGVAGGVSLGGSTTVVVSGVSLVTATWTHIALTFDGANLKVYVNGLLRGTEPAVGAPSVSTYPLTLGGNAGGQFFNGRIDDVRIYNRTLTESEIQADMMRPL